MMINLKPEHEAILDRAEKVGFSREQALEQAFSAIEASLETEDWLLASKDAIAAQIDEGFEQARRGELIDADDVVRILKDRHAKSKIA
jgi:predicted transcriptional regulator